MKIKIKEPDYTKYFAYQEIGMVKGYKLSNETTESETLIINYIRIEINLCSVTGSEFYLAIQDKFKPEKLKCKYVTNTNYVYSETKNKDIIKIEIKILTNKLNPKEVIAKKKLLYKINKYT